MRVASLTATSSLSLPANSYIYQIVNVNDKLAAISSDDSLRLIDLQSLREIDGGVLNNVHDGVTCLRLVDHEPNCLLTAGRNGVVQGYDLRFGQKTMQLRGSAGQQTQENQLLYMWELTGLSRQQCFLLVTGFSRHERCCRYRAKSFSSGRASMVSHPSQKNQEKITYQAH